MDEALALPEAAGLHFTTLEVLSTAECVGGSGATSTNTPVHSSAELVMDEDLTVIT